VKLTDRIDAFRKRHPEIQISLPPRQNIWQVREPGRPATMHPWAATMMDDLERRYDDKDSNA
jgi:hypothetical protein